MSCAMVVILATTCNDGGQRPCDRKTPRAYMDDEDADSTESTCEVILKSERRVIPKTLIESTLSASGMTWGTKMPLRPLLIITISRVFDLLSRRFFILAQVEMFSYSSVAVCKWEEPINK